MNLAENLSLSAASTPDAPAVRLDDVVLSYAALDGASARVAGLLAAKGVGPGDRVGIMLPNVPQFLIVYYGILRLGSVVVPMNVLLKGRETAFYLKNPGAKIVFAWAAFAEHARSGAAEAGAECIEVEPGGFERMLAAAEPLAEVAERAESDTAVILYTSGTTGVPKGAELSHHNLAHNCEAAIGLFGIGAASVTLGSLPLFHSFGQTCAMNATIRAGGCLTLIPRFDPAKALQVIERDGVSVFEGVPTMYGAILNHPSADSTDVSSLKVCACGGASLPVELDPLAFRREFAKDARMRGVLDTVGRISGWGKSLPAGVAQGIAVHHEYKGRVACVVELDTRAETVARKIVHGYTGPRVTKVFYAVDVGLPINTLGLKAQMMGGAMDGIAQALSYSLHLQDGYFLEGSWDDAFYTRQWNVPPELEVVVMDQTTNDPGGAGEFGVAAAMAATACAYRRATGKMPTEFPINHHDPLGFEVFPTTPSVPQSPTDGLKQAGIKRPRKKRKVTRKKKTTAKKKGS